MDWHRMFGLVLIDFFTGSPFIVELEKDLSLQQQFLDVAIIRRGKGHFHGVLPDGMHDLSAHNLVTFKSHHEALSDWALMELTGHFVNYRKQVRPARGKLLPLRAFELYAICSNYPHNLASAVPLEPVQEGVYNCQRGTNRIRIIVASQLPKAENNAPLHLFSNKPDKVGYGALNLQRHAPETSSVINDLFKGYKTEGTIMPYTMEDYRRDLAKRTFKDLTPQEQRGLLVGLPPADRREVLSGLSPAEQRELVADLPVEVVLASLPREKIEEFLKQTEERRATKKRSRRS